MDGASRCPSIVRPLKALGSMRQVVQAHGGRVAYMRIVCALVGIVLCAAFAGCDAPGNVSKPLSGSIHVSGSTALQPLAQKAAALFQQKYPQVKMDVQGGGSKTGLADVNSHKVDIGDSDIYADPALYPDPNLTDHLVCVIPFTMIANTDVTGVKSLTRQQIIDIYSTNKIRNWKDVGGPDLAIVPVVRLSSSGTRATFRKYILGGRDENGTVLQTESSQAVLQAVSSTPGAIGYLAASALNTTVQQIAIDGQNATPAAIEAGKYAFWGFEHMYTIGESDGPASQFLDFMLTSEVQQLAASLGYIPIADMQVATPATGSGATPSASTQAFARREGEHSYA